MKNFGACAILTLFFISINIASAVVPTFKIRKIQIGDERFLVEVAETDEQHQQGLMFRKKLGEHGQGMLFVFKNSEIRRFWMKNTFIDLDIGFFSEDKKLIDIQQMKAVSSEMEYSPPAYTSISPAQYALEMPKGWFKSHKIVIGNKLVLN